MTALNVQAKLAQRAQGREPSPIRAIFPLLSIPGMISFGGGYPNPDTFPFAGMDLHFKNGKTIRIEESDMRPALQYGPSDSDPNLLEPLSAWHKFKDNIELSKETLVVLNGSQEGLFIAGYLFLEPSDSVIVSEPTYPGAISAFSPFTKNFVPVPLDGQGMDTAALAKILEDLEKRSEPLPKMIYTIPNGHNPGGVAMALPRRKQLLELASKYDMIVLEDDPYQLVRLDDSKPDPTLQSLDTEGHVIRLDSFSKIFAPGLRVGYASGSAEAMMQFQLFKQSANLHTSSLTQNILASYLREATPAGFADEIKEKCVMYRSNRDVMVDAAKALLPAEAQFDIPGEGLFIWFRLPESCDTSSMVQSYSKELKVVLVPGPAFSTRGGCGNCMRASFSMVTKEQIEQGMERFAEMIKRQQNG